MKTKLEIIKETVEFYSEDTSRRALTQSQRCVYFEPKTKNMCAFGRCMLDPEIIYDSDSGFNSIESLHRDMEVDHLLKEEYRGHSTEFWTDIQFLHDNNANWNETGLTEFGQKSLDYLTRKYKDL